MLRAVLSRGDQKGWKEGLDAQIAILHDFLKANQPGRDLDAWVSTLSETSANRQRLRVGHE